MMVMSYRAVFVCSRISRIGSPPRTTISGETPNRPSFFASLARASRSDFSSPDISAIPSKVVAALVGAATSPPRRIGLSAGSVPSLQIRMRIKVKFVTGHERVNHDGRADQRQRDKSEPDFRSREILGRDRTDLRSDGRARMHDERDQNIDVAFDRVTERSVAGRDDDLEQVGAHGEVRRNSEHVDEHWHPDVAGAATEKTTEQTANERHQNDDPKRDGWHYGCRQRNHRPDFQPLDRRSAMTERRFVLFRRCAWDLRVRPGPFLILEHPSRFA